MAYTKEAIERELALEEEMFNRGKDRFFANIARLKEQRNEGGTTYGKMLLKRGIAPLAAAITAFMEKANSGTAGRRHMAVALLKDIAPDVAAFITLRTAIDTLTSEPMLQNVAVRVGREIEAELRLTNLKQNDADRYAMTQRYIQGHKSRKYRSTVLRYAYGKSTTVDFEPWPLAQCLHLGQKLIELAIDSTGIFAIELTSNKVRKGNKDMAAYSLVMTPALKEWMDDHLESRSIMAPAYMPTLIPPKPWEGACGGGYYFQAMRPLSLVKTGNRDYLLTLDKKIANNEMPSVLRAINALQDTPWRVNRQVYEVADHFWNDTNGDVADLPPRDGYRLPPCPVCGADITDTASARIPHACLDSLSEEELRRWRRAAAIVREKNISCMSRRLGIAKTLHLAARYKDEPAFYYPYQLDFRGRIYAVPAYLNPQGTGLAKALLQFAQGKALGSMAAVKWLAIHGSNCFGNDKVSLDDRYSWVLQHQDDIRLCAEDPYDNRWWTEADVGLPCLLLRVAGLPRRGAGLRLSPAHRHGRHLQRLADILAHPARRGGRPCGQPHPHGHAAGHLRHRGRQGEAGPRSPGGQACGRGRCLRQGGDREAHVQRDGLRPLPAGPQHQPQDDQAAGHGPALWRDLRQLP